MRTRLAFKQCIVTRLPSFAGLLQFTRVLDLLDSYFDFSNQCVVTDNVTR